MTFEQQRAYFTHGVLDNGFFSFLSDPPGLWKKRSVSPIDRATALAGRWRDALGRTNSVRHAVATWTGSGDITLGIPFLALTLYDDACSDPVVRPTVHCPTRETVRGWLETMGYLMQQLVEAEFGFDPAHQHLLIPFWTSGIALFEFFQDTKRTSPKFWDYFEAKNVNA